MKSAVRATAVLALAAGFAVLRQPAWAHPHIWVDSVVTFVFEGEDLRGLTVTWVFDEFYSMVLVEDGDEDGDGVLSEAEADALAARISDNLREVGYFIHLRLDGDTRPVERVEDFTVEQRRDQVAMSFTIPLPEGLDPSETDVALGIYDEEFFVSLEFDRLDPVRFIDAPQSCHFRITDDEANPIYFGLVVPLKVDLICGGGS